MYSFEASEVGSSFIFSIGWISSSVRGSSSIRIVLQDFINVLQHNNMRFFEFASSTFKKLFNSSGSMEYWRYE